jgi:elongation factor G
MEMFGYATVLRNLSSGRANFSMEFFEYQPIPASIQEEVLASLEEKKAEKK